MYTKIALFLGIAVFLAIINLSMVSAAVNTTATTTTTTPNNPTFCTQNSDCIYISGCDFCENANYFNSHPKPPCPINTNPTGNGCICTNNQCIITTSDSEYYLVIGVIAIMVLVIIYWAFKHFAKKS